MSVPPRSPIIASKYGHRQLLPLSQIKIFLILSIILLTACFASCGSHLLEDPMIRVPSPVAPYGVVSESHRTANLRCSFSVHP
ncbi:hypothetical protein SISNIDRAFT_159226 [Sistotremastrum niveocremeum HHB9708]|uniref:Uncharacterized protein n=1 Tax=Sistotremastrum niveocremeum HHB9708 TaxID=1314777 RepID=A0A164STX9_9AGAM|nr:hypothetical protein SISNIDRAFT_159226 [Sistotremastrum niveocremeum HHB9708]